MVTYICWVLSKAYYNSKQENVKKKLCDRLCYKVVTVKIGAQQYGHMNTACLGIILFHSTSFFITLMRFYRNITLVYIISLWYNWFCYMPFHLKLQSLSILLSEDLLIQKQKYTALHIMLPKNLGEGYLGVIEGNTE